MQIIDQQQIQLSSEPYQTDSFMDSRIYFHQYRRPRYTNPTYMSNHVNNSLTFFDNKLHQSNPIGNVDTSSQGRQNHRNNVLQTNMLKDNSIRQRYNTINTTFEIAPSNSQRYQKGNSYDRSHSNLSSYGSNSLSLNQNDIYNKQNSKFNIITMRPKQFDTSIRQHPKYTLQNKDQLYYKRMAQELQKKKMYEQAFQQRKIKNPNISVDSFAGKYTYGLERQKQRQSSKVYSVERNSKKNPESLYMEHRNYPASLQTSKGKKDFTPKMLNHMDQLMTLS